MGFLFSSSLLFFFHCLVLEVGLLSAPRSAWRHNVPLFRLDLLSSHFATPCPVFRLGLLLRRRTQRRLAPFPGWASFSVVALSDAMLCFRVEPPFFSRRTKRRHAPFPGWASFSCHSPAAYHSPSDLMHCSSEVVPPLAALRRLIALRAISCTVPPRLCLLSPHSSGLSPSERFCATFFRGWASSSRTPAVDRPPSDLMHCSSEVVPPLAAFQRFIALRAISCHAVVGFSLYERGSNNNHRTCLSVLHGGVRRVW